MYIRRKSYLRQLATLAFILVLLSTTLTLRAATSPTKNYLDRWDNYALTSTPDTTVAETQLADTTWQVTHTDSVVRRYGWFALKNNLVYDATLTPNIGMAVRLGRHFSMEVTAGYNPFTFSDNRKWRHLLVAPGLRYYPRHAMHGHYFGLDGVYSHYNVGNVKFPFGLYKGVRDERRQGDLVALGLSYGYEWHLASAFHLQAEIGLAGGLTKYDRYECKTCGAKLGDNEEKFLVPKLALNVVWVPGCKTRHIDVEHRTPIITPREPEPEPFEPVMAVVQPNTGTAGRLQRTDPVLHHVSEYRPYDRTRILRKENDALFVHFELDKDVIAKGFRENERVLDRIVDITRQIMADSTSNVRRIQLIGLASIEGTVRHNEQLGQARAEALKRYIQERVASPDSLYDVCNGGEAWADFRDQLNDLLLADTVQPGISKDQLRRAIRIIDTEKDPNRREWLLGHMDKSRPWWYIKRHVLADQRNSGYIRIYYDYVPDTKAAVINDASTLVQQERYQEAVDMLQSVKADPRSWNTLGVALYMSGRRAEGLSYLQKAAANGDPQAQDNLKHLHVK